MEGIRFVCRLAMRCREQKLAGPLETNILTKLNPQSVNYDSIADLLMQMKVYTSPSELHGLLCGHMAQGKAFDEERWLAIAATYLERESIEVEKVKKMLRKLYASTLHQLSGSGFDIQLVLPDMESDLSARVKSLGRWCLGFLTGFAASRSSQLSADLYESLDDLQEISDIQSDDLETSEDSEHDLMQVEEYVRMVVILAYSEMNAGLRNHNDSPDNHQPIH